MAFTETERLKVADYLQALAVLFGKKFSQEELNIWVKNFGFEGFTVQDIGRACVFFRQQTSLQFFPPFPQWVKAIRGEANPKIEAVEKWDEIMQLVISKGYYWIVANFKPESESALAFSLRAVGGIFRLCDADYERLSYLRHAFIEAYQCKAEALALPSAQNTPALSEPNVLDEQAEANKKKLNGIFADIAKSL